MRGTSDRRLAELARAGDERAFELMIERYRMQLLAHARRVAGENAAEDALQQGLACAWDSLRRGCEVRHVRAWLFAIVHNAALQTLGDGREATGEVTGALAHARSVEEEFERSVSVRAALSAVAALPLREREALVASSVDGRSTRELAKELGLGEGAVRQLLFRARTRARLAIASFAPPVIALRLRSHLARGWRLRALAGQLTRRAHELAVQLAPDALPSIPSPAAIGTAVVLVAAGAEAGNVALGSGSGHATQTRASHTSAAFRGTRGSGARAHHVGGASLATLLPAAGLVARSAPANEPPAARTTHGPATLFAASAGRAGAATNPGPLAPTDRLPRPVRVGPPGAPHLPGSPTPPAIPSIPEALGSAVGAVSGAAGAATQGANVPKAAEHVVTTVTGPVVARVERLGESATAHLH